jgi:hypothetical protein
VVLQNHEDEKISSEFFAVEGRLRPPFEVRLSASLLIVEVFETSPILLIEVLMNLFRCLGAPVDISVYVF